MVCGFSQSFVDYLFICRILIQYSRRRQWQPTPVLLPGKSHGWRSLVGCSPWGCEESGDWATSLSLFTFTHWRRKWQHTPLFLPGESQGWEPGGPPSVGSHRVGHDWCDLGAGTGSKPQSFCLGKERGCRSQGKIQDRSIASAHDSWVQRGRGAPPRPGWVYFWAAHQ